MYMEPLSILDEEALFLSCNGAVATATKYCSMSAERLPRSATDFHDKSHLSDQALSGQSTLFSSFTTVCERYK